LPACNFESGGTGEGARVGAQDHWMSAVRELKHHMLRLIRRIHRRVSTEVLRRDRALASSTRSLAHALGFSVVRVSPSDGLNGLTEHF